MMSTKKSLFRRLLEREVVQSVVLYAAIGFALLEGLGFVLEQIGVPGQAAIIRFLTILYVLGFPVTVFLSWFFDATRMGIRAESPGRMNMALALAISVLFLAGGASLVFLSWKPSAEVPKQVIPGTGSSAHRFIAVLPFQAIGGDDDIAYLAQGIPAYLRNLFGGLDGFQVLGPGTSEALLSQGLPVEEVGRRHGVGAVLEGTITQRAEQLFLSVALVDTENGNQLWGSSYTRPLSDVLDVQADIARSIVAAVQKDYLGQLSERLQSGMTTRFDAYHHYLLGREEQRSWAEERLARAQEHYRSALELDPDFAEAWAMLGQSIISWYSVREDDFEPLLDEVQAALDRALELDPGLAQAYLAYTELHNDQQEAQGLPEDPEVVRGYLERARDANPNLARPYLDLREFAASPEESDRLLLRAIQLDPLNPDVIQARAWSAMEQGRPTEAVSHLQDGLELYPESPMLWYQLGLMAPEAGELALAVQATERSRQLDPGSTFRSFGLYAVYMKIGLFEAAADWAAYRFRLRPFSCHQWVRALLGAGDEEGLQSLTLPPYDRFCLPFARYAMGDLETYVQHMDPRLFQAWSISLLNTLEAQRAAWAVQQAGEQEKAHTMASQMLSGISERVAAGEQHTGVLLARSRTESLLGDPDRATATLLTIGEKHLSWYPFVFRDPDWLSMESLADPEVQALLKRTQQQIDSERQKLTSRAGYAPLVAPK